MSDHGMKLVNKGDFEENYFIVNLLKILFMEICLRWKQIIKIFIPKYVYDI